MTGDPIGRDHELIERARRGERTGDPVIDLLGRQWRARILAQDTMPGGAPIYENLSDYHDVDVPDRDLGVDLATTMLPAVAPLVEYAGHTDVPAPAPVLSAADHHAIAAEVVALLVARLTS